MKRPLNKRRLTPVVLLLVLVLICGSVFAYMFHRTEDKSVSFIPAQVSCEVWETVKGNQKSGITVENTGNIDAYLRVRLVTYWVNSDGNVAAKSSPSLTINYDTEKWVEGSDNTFYYKTKVNPKGETADLLNGTTITLATDENGYKQVVDVFAEAIQADPTTAVTESWHVTLDTSGNIDSAP